MTTGTPFFTVRAPASRIVNWLSCDLSRDRTSATQRRPRIGVTIVIGSPAT
jgi:hypothetical protein